MNRRHAHRKARFHLGDHSMTGGELAGTLAAGFFLAFVLWAFVAFVAAALPIQ